MTEKRTFISPIEVPPISIESGKLQAAVHVHVVRSIFENGALIGRLPTHRVAVTLQPDGSWIWNKEPDAAIEDALQAAAPAITKQIDTMVALHGVIDHKIGTVNVSYVKGKDGLFSRHQVADSA